MSEAMVLTHDPNTTADATGVLPPLPPYAGASAEVKRAKQLHAAALDAALNMARVRGDQSAKLDTLTEARARLDELQRRAAVETVDSDELEEAAGALYRHEKICNGDAFRYQQQAAEEARRRAVTAYAEHAREHAAELFDSLAGEAHEASEALLKARAAIAEHEARYQRAHEASRTLASVVDPSLSIPSDGTPPLPELPENAAPEFVEIGGQQVPVMRCR